MQSCALLLFLILSNAFAIRTCGTHPSDGAIKKAEDDFKARTANSYKIASAGNTTRSAVVDVHFHVVAAGETLAHGWVPDKQIFDQIDVLNHDYSNTALSFKLVNVTRTINEYWFSDSRPYSRAQTEMKGTLRTGGPAALNVYTVGFETIPLLGYATFPYEYDSSPIEDGVLILYSTLPGGTTEPYNLGQTLTHEVGHWAGLYHTFQGGCGGVGDEVQDTPQQAYATNECPVGKDTCPGGGRDPIHNYMDYSDDYCMTEFTRGQARRLVKQLRVYRGLFAGDVKRAT